MTTEQMPATDAKLDGPMNSSSDPVQDAVKSSAPEALPKTSSATAERPMTWLQFWITLGFLVVVIATISVLANQLYSWSWTKSIETENQTTAQRLQELQAQTNRKLDVDQVTATQQLSMKGATDQINALNLEVQTLSKTVSAQSLRMTKLQHDNAQLVNGQVKLLKAFMEATEAANKNPGLAHRPIELHIEIPLGEIELPPQVTRPRI